MSRCHVMLPALLLSRLYLEKHEAKYKPALDKAIQFVLDSQYPIRVWPQPFPLKDESSHRGRLDYTSFLAFNDDVTAGNVELLVLCYRALGDTHACSTRSRAA